MWRWTTGHPGLNGQPQTGKTGAFKELYHSCQLQRHKGSGQSKVDSFFLRKGFKMKTGQNKSGKQYKALEMASTISTINGAVYKSLHQNYKEKFINLFSQIHTQQQHHCSNSMHTS